MPPPRNDFGGSDGGAGGCEVGRRVDDRSRHVHPPRSYVPALGRRTLRLALPRRPAACTEMPLNVF